MGGIIFGQYQVGPVNGGREVSNNGCHRKLKQTD